MGSALQHLRPAAWGCTGGRRLPDLIPERVVECAGIKLVVEDFQFEDPVVGRIPKARGARLRPRSAHRIGRPEDDGGSGHVPAGPFSRGSDIEVIVEDDKRSEGGDVRVSKAGFTDGIESNAILRTQYTRAGAACHG